MPVVIRPARETDRGRLRELTVEGFVGVSIDHAIEEKLGPIAATDWAARKGRHLDDDMDVVDGVVLVADESGEAVGYVSLRFDREAQVGRIPNLAVWSSLRGQGIGRMLLEAALARFRDEGMAVARIETLEHNPIGRHLYPSVGFVEVARQVHYAIDVRGSR